MTPEQKYIASVSLEHRKKYAQFFTPECIAAFMCRWVMQGKSKKNILEPAYGLGVFSRILAQSPGLKIDAYETDNKIFSFAEANRPTGVDLKNEDYLKSGWEKKYDAIVCNPPYLKFHDYDNTAYIPDVNNHLGTKLNGFTNIYTLFLLKSIAQLRKGGRLAYIVPSEFLNSDYGVEVKRALIESNTLKHIIIVDFTECAFNDTLTTACILLCEETESATVRFSTLTDVAALDNCLGQYLEYGAGELDASIKWKAYYEKGNSCKYNNLVPFSRFARVSRGIATGANSYFTFRRSKANAFNIPEECLTPCICKAADVQQTFFTLHDFNKLAGGDKAAYLFNGQKKQCDPNVKRYISLGEQEGVDKRYLTASRKPWYSIENRPPAPIWVSVFNRNGLRFVRNESKAFNLTTFHCVYPKSSIDTDVLFAYLITDVAKEILMDNSRQYGNGLVKFEPNDLNKGMVADLYLLNEEELRYIKDVYHYIKVSHNEKKGIALLNNFFENKFTIGTVDLEKAYDSLKLLKEDFAGKRIAAKGNKNGKRATQLDFLDLLCQSIDEKAAAAAEK